MNITRRQLGVGLATSPLWVSACSRSSTADLSALRIAGLEPLEEWDACLVRLNLRVVELADAFGGRGATTSADGQTLAANAQVSNADIAQSVDAALGSDWRRAEEGFMSGIEQNIDTMVWETTRGPRRYYGLALMREVLTSTTGRQLRPLMSVFTRA